VAPDADGQVLNINADTAAAALAVALGAEKLIVLTDVEGLYVNWPESDDVVGTIGPEALSS
jgi:acetylglutamate kinase